MSEKRRYAFEVSMTLKCNFRNEIKIVYIFYCKKKKKKLLNEKRLWEDAVVTFVKKNRRRHL